VRRERQPLAIKLAIKQRPNRRKTVDSGRILSIAKSLLSLVFTGFFEDFADLHDNPIELRGQGRL
jgi:hypothetical protein